MGGRGVVWKLIALSAGVVTCLSVAPSAFAGGSKPDMSVSGAAFTTINQDVDGPDRCKDGNPVVNCNLYAGKIYVWLNGGPAANRLRTAGKYFFAVLAPGGQSDPNDGTPENLSDNFDTYQNRTFTVTNGEVSAYAGTHDQDVPLIRLAPFADTPNPGGVYIMAVCYIGPANAVTPSYPVDPKSCKYDMFKAPATGPDTTPPVCVLTNISADGRSIQVLVQDPDAQAAADTGSGVEDITVNTAVNATVTYTPSPWYPGTFSPVVVTATKIDPTKSSFLKLTVTNVAGLSTVCDPELPGTKRPLLIRRGGR